VIVLVRVHLGVRLGWIEARLKFHLLVYVSLQELPDAADLLAPDTLVEAEHLVFVVLRLWPRLLRIAVVVTRLRNKISMDLLDLIAELRLLLSVVIFIVRATASPGEDVLHIVLLLLLSLLLHSISLEASQELDLAVILATELGVLHRH